MPQPSGAAWCRPLPPLCCQTALGQALGRVDIAASPPPDPTPTCAHGEKHNCCGRRTCSPRWTRPYHTKVWRGLSVHAPPRSTTTHQGRSPEGAPYSGRCQVGTMLVEAPSPVGPADGAPLTEPLWVREKEHHGVGLVKAIYHPMGGARIGRRDEHTYLSGNPGIRPAR